MLAALALVALGSAALVSVAVVALRTAQGQRVDDRARWAVTMPRSGLGTVLDVLAVVSIGTVGLSLAVFLVASLVRRTWLAGLAAVLLVAGANITTQALKVGLLDRPDFGIGTENSLPSGHTTVATSLGLAAILVFPRRWRPMLVGGSAGLATFVGAGTLVNGWHRPSDVIAAYAVCAVWGGLSLLTLASFRPRGGPWPPPSRSTGPSRRVRYGSWALAGSAAVGVVFLGLGLGYGGTVTNLVLGAASLTTIGLVSAMVTAAMAVAADGLAGVPSGPVGWTRATHGRAVP